MNQHAIYFIALVIILNVNNFVTKVSMGKIEQKIDVIGELYDGECD
jgi:hypothetical protein